MKKTGILAVLLALCVLFTSGCMAGVFQVEVLSDGNAILTTMVGYTEDGMAFYAPISVDNTIAVDQHKETAQEFTYNGVTYYGGGDKVKFNNLDILADSFNQTANGTHRPEAGGIRFVKNPEGTLSIYFDATAMTGDLSELVMLRDELKESGKLTETKEKELKKDLAVKYEFLFPVPVKQVAGPQKGVTIEDKKLTLDIVSILENLEGTLSYEFVTEPMEAFMPAFSDVTVDKWYFAAVKAMSKAGTVNGMGDGSFAPENAMTYAQFCQLLAKRLDAAVGEENGYWAGKAIRFCLDNELILSRGEITPANYDAAITREAAIAAMYRAFGGQVVKENPAIPDAGEIAEEYREDVLGAYKVGITSGVDEAGTFMPTAELRRAEVCQLFYNIK